MAMFYPRKQTLFILLVSFIAVAGMAIYVKISYSSSASPDVSANPSPSLLAANIEKIPGNSDWKKQFIDASSTTSFTSTATTKSAAPQEKLTATDILGRQFFTKYAELKQQGLTTDQQTVSDVANQLVQSSLSNIQTPQPYTIKNIRVLASADASALTSYANSLSSVLSTYVPDQDHNEAVIAEQALDQNDMSILTQIDPIIAHYKTAIQSLLAMRVPQAVAQSHLDLVNGLQIALFNAQALRHVDTDPVRGMAAVGLEVTALQTMDTAMTNIKQYLSNAGVPMS